MVNKQWFLIENEQEYEQALARYDALKSAKKQSVAHREKMLLVHLISIYEQATSIIPEIDPIEMIKIRMADFGYKSADLAKEYGDKGTVSKVMNYKQALSLTMIRKFSKLLNLPVESLIREYDLVPVEKSV